MLKLYSSHILSMRRTELKSRIHLRWKCSLSVPFQQKQQQQQQPQQYLSGNIPLTCGNISVHYDETSYVQPYISTCSDLRKGTRGGARLCFFRPFRHEGTAEERVLLVATAVLSCEASPILEEPLGRSGTKLLWRTKN